MITMRRKAAIVLVAGMMMAAVGCGQNNQAGVNEPTSQTETTVQDNSNGGQTEGSVGSVLLADFQEKIKADASMAPEAMAKALLTNQVIGFKGMAVEVQPGNLTGFTAEVKGFEKGAMFSPTIGTIPFVGYIFQTADAASAEKLVEALKATANPGWNVCTCADETVIEASGNTVFCVMCPTKFED